MKSLVSSRSGFSVLFVSCLLLSGCSTPTATRSRDDGGAAEALNSWRPHLLYLLPSPHPRLHVEVDAVEGSEPDHVVLERLRGFLSTHCRKPDGIEVVRGDVIPAEAARGISPGALARKYINGPDKTNASPPAFVYVLYYNFPLSRGSAADRILHRGASTMPARRPQKAVPYAEVYPYPAIYFNTAFSLGIAMNEILLHETGHLLGLVNRSAHARNGHCLNRACQMNTHRAYLRQFRWLPGRRESPLCAECVAELAQSSAQTPLSNLRYVGPVLVRSGVDYHVATLPDRVGIIVGSLTDRDCREFAAAMRPERSGPGDDGRTRMHCLVKDSVLKEPGKLSDILKHLKGDPFGDVRRGGPSVFLRACAVRYQALGQYTNAIDTLQQAILLDSKDHWLHNQLGWIKATSPDTAVRSGRDAVSAARKACELTEWRNWRYVDTLAAAYAEAGNFKRAIEMQGRALRTGNPTESEQKLMRERLSLYKQSQPFRAKLSKPE